MKRHFESDVVLTTFATIAQDLNKKRSVAQIHYFRIVLDEGNAANSQLGLVLSDKYIKRTRYAILPPGSSMLYRSSAHNIDGV